MVVSSQGWCRSSGQSGACPGHPGLVTKDRGWVLRRPGRHMGPGRSRIVTLYLYLISKLYFD